jgi:hypothetical protein
MKRRKGIDGKLDTAWAKLVKLKAGMKCEYCHTTTKQLHSHHVYSRSKKSTRWDVLNGICLCAGHHVLSSTFSAHKTPIEFTEWYINYKGTDFVDRLRLKANTTSKLFEFEKKLLLEDLLTQIKEHEH